MRMTALRRASAVAVMIAICSTGGAIAQSTVPEVHHAHMSAVQATPSSAPEKTAEQGQGMQPGQSMSPGAMGQGMMAKHMMGNMMQSGMANGMPMKPMPGHMMKIMFAVIDANGDGGISFEELMNVEKRIFDEVDANKDGKVTLDELGTFMRE